MPLFYTTAWLWAKAFSTAVLTLRLYSCVAMCAALLVTWRTRRRFYGTFATAFGVLTFWGASGLVLDENAEARFYGLFLRTVALALNIYTRLNVQLRPKLQLLVLSLFSQSALVLSHVLGTIYGTLMLLGLILSDAAKRRFRLVSISFMLPAGWLSWSGCLRSELPWPWASPTGGSGNHNLNTYVLRAFLLPSSNGSCSWSATPGMTGGNWFTISSSSPCLSRSPSSCC
jgi:hypothetical protein